MAQATENNEIAFNVVKLDEGVVDVLAARPRPAFQERFKKYLPAPELKIAIGDTVSVVIWEAGPNGLFGNSLTELSRQPRRVSPYATEPSPSPFLSNEQTSRSTLAAPLDNSAGPDTAASSGAGTTIPVQPVGPDGTITIPYAGRVVAAGRTATELGRRIEALLSPIAIDPQALVLVQAGGGSAVTVAGDTVKGARVPLSPGGTRLLEVIAAAGGADAPVQETFVRLTRDGVTATAPLSVLVADPAQNIFARPGDVVIVSRVPQTLSVFGASGKNASITFDTEHLSLAEALAKAGGLLDERADASAIFVMRYEPVDLVRTLGQPTAARAPAGLSPVVYRLDLADAKSYLLAKRFSVRDKDIVFVAEAKAVPITRALQTLARITGPASSALLICRSTNKC